MRRGESGEQREGSLGVRTQRLGGWGALGEGREKRNRFLGVCRV